jgi:hypothetical protein
MRQTPTTIESKYPDLAELAVEAQSHSKAEGKTVDGY